MMSPPRVSILTVNTSVVTSITERFAVVTAGTSPSDDAGIKSSDSGVVAPSVCVVALGSAFGAL